MTGKGGGYLPLDNSLYAPWGHPWVCARPSPRLGRSSISGVGEVAQQRTQELI